MSRMSDLALERDAGRGIIVRRFLPQTAGGPTVCREIRAEGESTKVVGYAALFDVVADLGWWREVIRPGAFAESLRNGDDVRGLFNHNADLILGRTKAGTLTLEEDGKGLWYEDTLPDTQVARDLLVSLERGDITGSSFAFQVLDDSWHMEDGEEVREIRRVKLYDVSPVTYPAYDETSAEARDCVVSKSLQDFRRRRAAEADALDLAARCAGIDLTPRR